MIPAQKHSPTIQPKISVITIVWNGRQFVEHTIASVLGQSYANKEYIVIDGGSTDGTVDVIKEYESQITYWVSEKDHGISDAFNKGLARATGDYLLFLNADDALSDVGVLEGIAQKIIENKFPILIYGDCDVLDRDTDVVLYRASIEITLKSLKKGKMLPQPSLFAHRSYFEKYGTFDSRFKIAMDYEWLLRSGLKETIVHVPMLVTSVRDGGVSTLDQARVVNEIILALKKNNYISSRLGELKLRGYYSGRTLARSILGGLGLYKSFNNLRNRLVNHVGGASASSGRN